MGEGGGPDPPLVLPLLPGFNMHLLKGKDQRLHHTPHKDHTSPRVTRNKEKEGRC